MPARHPFLDQLAAAWPPPAWADVTVLVAVSGGADSVALLRGLHALRAEGPGRLCVGHFQHGLRAEAEDEARFVAALSAQLGLRCEIGRSATPLADEGDSLERAAREARYGFLREAADRLGARYVAVAHTANDQAETILHRIVRGTGLAGLGGMARARPLGPMTTLIRPMLAIVRRRAETYLQAIQQPYREDATNRDPRFTRSRIRHDLLPRLAEQYNPNVAAAILRLGSLAREAQEVIDGVVGELAARAVGREGKTILVAAAPLAGQPRYLVRELLLSVWRAEGWPLQAMGHDAWEVLASMLAASHVEQTAIGSKVTFPGCIVAEVTPGVLRLTPPVSCT